MIDINRETGTVSWDGFRLYPQLTHDKFIELYPLVECSSDNVISTGLHYRNYDFPETRVEDYLLRVNAIYNNEKLWHISFTRDDVEFSEDDLGMPELAKWGNNIHLWFLSKFGEPHKTRSASFFDEEDFLSPEEIQFLETWSYKFEWGNTGFDYDPVRVVAYITNGASHKENSAMLILKA